MRACVSSAIPLSIYGNTVFSLQKQTRLEGSDDRVEFNFSLPRNVELKVKRIATRGCVRKSFKPDVTSLLVTGQLSVSCRADKVPLIVRTKLSQLR